jgi:protein-S-isoprenylcysteine O-methyltransferase Ste14
MNVSAYVQSAIFLILAAVALFAGAGTIAILGFWLYLAILAAIIVASLLALDPGLLRERMRPGGQRPPSALRLFTIVMFLHWIVAGLDRGRFHWSDGVPSWIEALGLIALAARIRAVLLGDGRQPLLLLGRAHSVRPRPARGRARAVRLRPAPGLFASIVIMLASGLALGSWLAALLVIASSLPFLLYRAISEDRVLQTELPGYADYARRVRWRLVPGIW